MMASAGRFRELSRALHWRPTRLVAMIWAYFDESGVHNLSTSKLEWLVIGGALATEDNWARLSEDWKVALEDAKINVFHMTDFETYNGEFEGWTEEQHDVLLDRLLVIQAKYVHEIFGATHDNKKNMKQRKVFRKIYRNNVADIIMIAANHLMIDQNDPISLMFAAHKEITHKNLEGHFMDLVRDDDRFAECVVGKPKDYPPLQMADLIAYELSHSIGSKTVRPSLARIKESAKNVTLYLIISNRTVR
jgi:uncharacterized phage-like protein YoqJ